MPKFPVIADNNNYWQEKKLDSRDCSMLLDSTLLQAARLTYRAYLEVHCDQMQRPAGVVINTANSRGQLIFSSKPVLLPDECYVPFEEIESRLY